MYAFTESESQLRQYVYQRTHPLRVDLADVGQALGQDVGGHLIAKLVPELGGLALGSLRERPSIGNGACDDAADRGGDLEDVRDGRRVDELVLWSAVSAASQYTPS